MFICGEKKVVVVDDRFPFCKAKNDWAFSRTSAGKEIWVLLLEKAWAKVFGSYQRIEGGTCDEALHPLTGCPTKNFIHNDCKNKERLWQTIIMADQQNFPMCTAAASSTEDDCNADEMVSAGLVDNHAYSLIGAKEITTESGKPIRLCLLRNPWGKKEWTGAWSDNSAQWTEHMKAQVPNFLAKNDGCFWI